MSNRYDPDYPSRDSGFRDSGFRDSGSRDSGSRDSGSREQGRFRDWPRREDRSMQSDQRREDDYSASDYRSRYSAEDRYDLRNPSRRYTRQDVEDESSSYAGSPYYGAGYPGPVSQQASFSSRASGCQAERWSRAEPNARDVYHQGQAWSQEPRTGEPHGYDYEARWPAGSGSEAYHRPVRWRSETELAQRDARSSRSGAEASTRSFGNYGKGPKGYVRSDERIREDVCDRLSDDDELDASDISVTVSNGEVRLEGTVLDRYSKHRAEDVADAVSGVRDVTNNLRTRKGFFQEVGDKLSGDDKSEHRGHAGSGTQSTPNQNANLQNSTLQNSTKSGLSANR
jgi:osmotically-inducible protein OsmY